MRVIGCGSRSWKGLWAEARVDHVLTTLMDLCDVIDEELQFIHGGCHEGGDAIIDRWVRRRMPYNDGLMEPEIYEANWKFFGRSAGPIRNTHMAKLKPKADLCLAFLRDDSDGTTDMITKARGEAIWTVVIPWEVKDDSPVGTNL